MEEKVKKAFDEYKMIITNWYNAYLNEATGEENDQCLWEDFWRDIEELLMPQIGRHVQVGHINQKEFEEFRNWLGATYQSLVAAIRNVPSLEINKEFKEIENLGLDLEKGIKKWYKKTFGEELNEEDVEKIRAWRSVIDGSNGS